MKLESNSAAVEVNGQTGTTQFRIAMNGKAFRVLSDTLYKNKIGSIVRELSCNAYDSHIQAGTPDRSFTIHMPDAFEPWFSIQDYGIGLSPEDVTTVFTVYFESTKEASNDVIGAFGLGAKTPFSYTDQFTITTVKNGKKYVYSAYITESGVPDIAEMHSEDSTEATGVEIRLSVKRQDFLTFQAEVENQLKYFKVKPEIQNGSASFETEDTSTALISTKNIQVYPKTRYGNICTIVQGNVGYPLDSQELQGKLDDASQALLNKLYGWNTVLFFDIGQIGVTASREGVEYSALTISSIKNKMQQFSTDIDAVIQAELQGMKTDWERYCFLNSNSLYANFASYPTVPKIEKGMILTGLVRGQIQVRNFNARGKKWFNVHPNSTNEIWIRADNTGSKSYFIIKDTSSRIQQRVEKLLENQRNAGITQIYLIDPLLEDATALVNRLKKTLGDCPDICKASDIVLDKAVRKSYTPSTFYRYNGASQLRSWNKIVDKSFADITEKTLYIVTKNMQSEDENLIYMYRRLSNNKELPKLISLRATDLPKIKDNANLQPLREYLAEEKEKLTLDNTAFRKYIKTKQMQEIAEGFRNHNWRTASVHKAIKQAAPDSFAARLLIALSTPDSKADAEQLPLYEMLGWDDKKRIVAQRRYAIGERLAKRLYKTYPLTQAVFSGYYSERYAKEVADYIALVGK